MTRKLQYGFLLVLYIGRAGRATLDGPAESLNLSKSFLASVARELRLAGIIKSVRGPGGGYELIGSPTVGEVYSVLGSPSSLSRQELDSYKRGEFEHRALARLSEDFNFASTPVLKRKIVGVSSELVTAEIYQMNGVTGRGH